MELREAVEFVLRRAGGRSGAEAEVVAAEGDALEAGVRLGRTEKLKRSRERRVALRVFTGGSCAVVSTADLAPEALAALVEECAILAGATAADPLSGLPDLAGEGPLPSALDLFDPAAEHVTAEDAISLARVAEEAALGSDPRVSNSEGAEFSSATRRLIYASSGGFRGEVATSSFSLSVVPVARDGGGMQRDYWYTTHRDPLRLEGAESVGRTAGEVLGQSGLQCLDLASVGPPIDV